MILLDEGTVNELQELVDIYDEALDGLEESAEALSKLV